MLVLTWIHKILVGQKFLCLQKSTYLSTYNSIPDL